MRPAHSDERAVGIGYYVSDADGTGGRLRDRPEDFRVRELESFETVSADADPGSYPDLVLRATLRDRDTNGFAGDLADRLGISRERITWAGTKDKRAVTTQLFAVRGWEGAPTVPEVPGADVEVVGRAGRPVLFGDLRGNAFEIVVREPDRPGAAAPVTETLAAVAGGATPAPAPGDGEVVDAGREGDGDEDGDAGAVDDCDGTDGRSGGAPDATLPLSATVGVPNVFGMQRFGSLRPVTHLVGLAVVRGDWEDAVLTYLGETADAEPGETRAAREYVVETRDWQGALERFPDRLGYERSLLHRLVERTGSDGGATAEDYRGALEALPTNVQTLLVHAAQSLLFNRTLTARLERGLPFARPVAGDVVCFADDDGVPDVDRLQRVTDGRVETVARHCERGRAFVTAPLVGTDTELGDGVPGEIERAVLDDAGIAPGDFDLPGEFGSTGTRRAVLVRTDLEIEAGARDGEGTADEALTFAFDLPKGSYATVVLREYLKLPPAAMA